MEYRNPKQIRIPNINIHKDQGLEKVFLSETFFLGLLLRMLRFRCRISWAKRWFFGRELNIF